jgi:hypothetical protein
MNLLQKKLKPKEILKILIVISGIFVLLLGQFIFSNLTTAPKISYKGLVTTNQCAKDAICAAICAPGSTLTVNGNIDTCCTDTYKGFPVVYHDNNSCHARYSAQAVGLDSTYIIMITLIYILGILILLR